MENTVIWKDYAGTKKLGTHLTAITLLVLLFILSIIFSYSIGTTIYPFLHPLYLTLLIIIFASAVYVTLSRMKKTTIDTLTNSSLGGEGNMMMFGAILMGLFTQVALYFIGVSSLELLTTIFQIMFFVVLSALVFFYVMMMKLISYSTLTEPVEITTEGISLKSEKIYPDSGIGFNAYLRVDKHLKWKDIKKINLIQEKGYSLDDFIGFRLRNPYIEVMPKKGNVVKARISDSNGFIEAMHDQKKAKFESMSVTAESVGLVLAQERIKLGNAYLTTGITLIMAYLFVMQELIFQSKQGILVYLTYMPYAIIPYLIIIVFGLFYLKFKKELKPAYHEYHAG